MYPHPRKSSIKSIIFLKPRVHEIQVNSENMIQELCWYNLSHKKKIQKLYSHTKTQVKSNLSKISIERSKNLELEEKALKRATKMAGFTMNLNLLLFRAIVATNSSNPPSNLHLPLSLLSLTTLPRKSSSVAAIHSHTVIASHIRWVIWETQSRQLLSVRDMSYDGRGVRVRVRGGFLIWFDFFFIFTQSENRDKKKKIDCYTFSIYFFFLSFGFK